MFFFGEPCTPALGAKGNRGSMGLTFLRHFGPKCGGGRTLMALIDPHHQPRF